MPAANRAGNTRTDQSGNPCAAWLAERPSSATSVAVSNPSPNRKPSRNMCQARAIRPNSGRHSRASKPPPRSTGRDLPRRSGRPLHAAEDAPERAQDDQIDDRDGEQEQRRGQRADQPADLPEALEPPAEQWRRGRERRRRPAPPPPSGRARRTGRRSTDRSPRLHQLARDVVDRRDVIGIDGVPQPEAPGKQGRAQQHGLVVERDERPGPGRDIRQDQRSEKAHEGLHAYSNAKKAGVRQRDVCTIVEMCTQSSSGALACRLRRPRAQPRDCRHSC